ncbi:formylglycine-generating enzyme family protein [Pseudoalteromonas luteoviolacea]|uniref:Sulfatase-modifying factor enzyme-like domain-containing protein n=1 Tax=Pseudoalteromonas luteoviolacea H33 TaxID=1365251 RepID=A0A167FNT8_9GAMM|nr:formylglycine-generating enzyme family protein [Pseudoalteromonas luteoviolacea]KZN52566.1 hypothetical protein N476_10915 [Pseudoalteromonas luteoviolacea H33]KZN76502.1 hypothetical protein N477_15440 [Pseudoalteromonas luteoviolacea H33-S]MBQ4876998.1 formylglycine-generating enzyme family protein [Pseudoalteromonas luteoviolacea]MBQ4905859.1 formylglycine-generating enzyme family protein [Pseudoalteromonas luteoviolacea]
MVDGSHLDIHSERLALSEFDNTKRWQLMPPKLFPAPWANEHGFDKYGLWQRFSVKGVSQTMRYITPGIFLMGSLKEELGRQDNEYSHVRDIKNGFWIADTAVTQGLWTAVMGENPSVFSYSKHARNLPVENVNWFDSQRFCQRLNRIIPELKVTLPDEAQREYACRAGTRTVYWWGNEVSTQHANYYNMHRGPVDVASYAPNEWGLYQVHGNVWEWCQNIWKDDLSKYHVLNGLNGLLQNNERNNWQAALRGGSWKTSTFNFRAATRIQFNPKSRYSFFGLRLAITE